MSGRLLVLRPGAIGDTLVTTPALWALRRRFPGLRIEVAGNATALPLLAASSVVDCWLPFDDPRVTRLFVPRAPAPDDALVGLDVAVAWCADPDGTVRSSLAHRGASEIVVAPSRPPPGRTVHAARHLLETLRPLGIDGGAALDVPEIRLPDDAHVGAQRGLALAGLEGRPFVAIHPGSGSPAKNWPAERFAEVILVLEARYGLASLVLSGPADDDALARLRSAMRKAPAVLVGQPLTVVAAIIQQARAFLGNDSGSAHLAGQVGCPTVALFGPSNPAIWSPLGPRVLTVRTNVLADLTVPAVLDALVRVADL